MAYPGSVNMEPVSENALVVDSAYKRYSVNNVVLKGLNMNVPKGAIYGLLGPSGCGKTTLLNCIMGRISLDSGQIRMKAKKKSDVGYMPQDVALYSTLSIRETFLYYGGMYGMTRSQVDERSDVVIKLLDLPSESSIVECLSGGQQRRVSFAVALLHDPQLLILDEPTVGLDPLLSQSIWEHLLKLASGHQKSIIITTHYIEEARQAHVVGMMRGGSILAESPPLQLMSAHSSSTLEQAFLHLCQKQSSSEDDLRDNTNYPTDGPVSSPLTEGSLFSVSRFRAQLIKNLLFMLRNKPMMMFLFGLPLLQCTLYNLAIGRDPEGLKIAVVNRELEHGLSDCLMHTLTGCNLNIPLSCRYIKQLRTKTVNLVEFRELSEARHIVERNEAWGLLHFASNYSEALIERMNSTIDGSDGSLENSDVDVWMDMSNQYIGNQLRKDIVTSFVDFLQGIYRDCSWPEQIADIPIKTEDPIYGTRNPSFIHFASPAVIIVFEFYLPMMFTVGVIIQEKVAGILERSMAAGLTALEIVAAHSVVQAVVLCVQTAVMIVVMYHIFDSPFVGDFYWTTGLLLLQGVCGMCYGFLVSVASDSMTTASMLGLGSFFPLSLTSGMVWPQEGMHAILKAVGWLLPLSLSTEAIRALTARGWTIDHPTVYYGYISTIVWILIFILAVRCIIKVRGLRGK
ncbi:ABC transporter G family member 23-like [Lycorma delicatula]|uniref:ABC transporter G family member 23-like n=1 Tax=Lycorma delicatula TaxID=130591 RepID=UPI003F5132D5